MLFILVLVAVSRFSITLPLPPPTVVHQFFPPTPHNPAILHTSTDFKRVLLCFYRCLYFADIFPVSPGFQLQLFVSSLAFRSPFVLCFFPTARDALRQYLKNSRLRTLLSSSNLRFDTDPPRCLLFSPRNVFRHERARTLIKNSSYFWSFTGRPNFVKKKRTRIQLILQLSEFRNSPTIEQNVTFIPVIVQLGA